MKEIWAIVDVYNRGGASSLGTVFKVATKRFTLEQIAQAATKRAGGPDSGGYIPAIGVKLNKRVEQGTIISESLVDEIYGTSRNLRSIQDPDRTMTRFDYDELLKKTLRREERIAERNYEREFFG